MILQAKVNDRTVSFDTSESIDICIPVDEGLSTVNCFYAPPARFEPVKLGDFIGDTRLGGAVNFKNVFFNPHGNGTHTECVGHIAKEAVRIDEILTEYLHIARVVSVYPTLMDNGDKVITKDSFQGVENQGENSWIIRTLPNPDNKRYQHYSGTNPTYFDPEVMSYLIEMGIEHLLVDLPSVDREEDGGVLASHHRFWEYPEKKFVKRTITELVYIPDYVHDGLYLLHLLVPAINLDAAPSRPILYPML
jgi:kynurenine formamidase